MKPIATLAICAIIATLTACNTVQGIGRDVKATGGAIERTAKKAQQ